MLDDARCKGLSWMGDRYRSIRGRNWSVRGVTLYCSTNASRTITGSSINARDYLATSCDWPDDGQPASYRPAPGLVPTNAPVLTEPINLETVVSKVVWAAAGEHAPQPSDSPETFVEITERPELRKTTFSQPASWFMAKKEEIAPEFMVRHVLGCETCRGANAYVQSGPN